MGSYFSNVAGSRARQREVASYYAPLRTAPLPWRKLEPHEEVPWPRKLRPNELIAIEVRYPQSDYKALRRWHLSDKHVYEPGCEHDAHGVCTVLKKQNPVSVHFRLSIFKRILRR